MDWQWDVVLDNKTALLEGLVTTLKLTGLSLVGALVLGMLVALARLSTFAPLSWLAMVWINVLRAIPPFVFIIYIYYGIAMAMDVTFTALGAGVLALSLQYSAWLAEVFRSGIIAVAPGQREAAVSLGFGPVRTFWTITLPQALRLVVGPLGNNIVGLVKDSSLASFIGVFELVRTSQLLVSQTFRPFEVYTAAVLLYLAVTLVLSGLVTQAERHLDVRRSGGFLRRITGRGGRRRIAALEAKVLAATPVAVR